MTLGRTRNQREHIRHRVQMPADLQVGGYEGMPVTVQDFCLGGMLLRFTDSAMASREGLSPRKLVTVSAEVDGLRGTRQVLLPARVVRVDSGLAGVQFDQPDTSALLALQNHVRALLSHQTQQRHHQDVALNEAQIRAALLMTRETVSAFLDDRLLVLLEELQAGDEGASPDARAVDWLSASGPALRSATKAGVLGRMEDMARGPSPEADQCADATEAVPADEMFAHWLSLKVMAIRAETDLQDPLMHLQVRLHELFAISLNLRRNPLHPVFVCEAFASALSELAPDAVLAKRLVAGFDTRVIDRLGDLYDQCNTVLASHGVLPDLDVTGYLSGRYRRLDTEPAGPGSKALSATD